MAVRMHLFGAKKLKHQMRLVRGVSNKSVKFSLETGGKMVRDTSASRAPVRTGNLRESAYLVKGWGGLPSAAKFVDPPEHNLERLKRDDRIKIQAARQDLPALGKKHHYGVEVGHTVYYAIFQHEGFSYRGGSKSGHKFLEHSYTQHKGVFADFIRMKFREGVMAIK